jgi:hypothetical protein
MFEPLIGNNESLTQGRPSLSAPALHEKNAICVLCILFREYFPSCKQTIESRRKTSINRHLHDNFQDLLL